MSTQIVELVRRAQSGDAEAFDALVGCFQDAAVAFGVSVTGDVDDAEDIAQEAFVDAFLRLATLREPAAFASWFRTVLRKHVDRLVRKRRGVSFDALSEATSPEAGPDELLERTERHRHVQAAVHVLPQALREAVLIHYFGGLDIRQTAAFLGVPAGTIKRRLHDARRRMRAGSLRHWEEAITKKRPSRDERFAERVRALIRAAAEGRAREVRELLAQEPGALEAEGPHPHWGGRPRALHTAAERGRLDVVDALLAAGAQPDPPSGSYDGWTPLFLAVTGGHEAIVERLLVAGAVMDAWSAAARGDRERLGELLQSDPASVHARGPNRATPLHFAVTLDVARMLVDAGADHAALDQYGATPTRALAYSRTAERAAASYLHALSGEADVFIATALGDHDRVREFVRHEPQLLESLDSHLNAASAWGGRPLHIAASRGDIATAALLLELGADANGRARDGETPLHHAAKYGDAAMIRLLLEAGADPSLRDHITDTAPDDWADFFERRDVIPLLRASG